PVTSTLSLHDALPISGLIPTFTAAVTPTVTPTPSVTVLPGGNVQFVDSTTGSVLSTATLPGGSGTVTVALSKPPAPDAIGHPITDRKSTRLNSSHRTI